MHEKGEVEYKKIPGAENCSDLMTKHLPVDKVEQLLPLMGA